jgi:hypothetical protein
VDEPPISNIKPYVSGFTTYDVREAQNVSWKKGSNLQLHRRALPKLIPADPR